MCAQPLCHPGNSLRTGRCPQSSPYFNLSGIIVLCCLISSILKTSFKYILPLFFVCFRSGAKSGPCSSILVRSRSPNVIIFNSDNLVLFNDRENGMDKDVRDGGEETIVGMGWEGMI